MSFFLFEVFVLFFFRDLDANNLFLTFFLKRTESEGARKRLANSLLFLVVKGTLLPIRNVPKCNKTGHKA